MAVHPRRDTTEELIAEGLRLLEDGDRRLAEATTDRERAVLKSAQAAIRERLAEMMRTEGQS